MKKDTALLLNVVLALVLIGVLVVYSTTAVRAYMNEGGAGGSYFPWRHLTFVGIGLALMVSAAFFDYHRFQKRGLLGVVVVVSLVFLVLVLIFGVEIRGAKRWLNLFGLQFQPSELAKFALVVFMAVKLAENQEHMPRFWRGFFPPFCIMGLFAGLIVLQRDLGTPVLLGGAAMIMILAAGARWRHVLAGVAPLAGAAVALVISEPYRIARIVSFVDPWRDRTDTGYQLIESLAGFARGGLWGRGLGAGEQKLFYLPDAHSDFIFAVWGEEMGLIGALCVVALFTLFLVLATRITMCAPDALGTVLGAGIVFLIVGQAIVNMGVTTGLLPTKGVGLPFISEGGSSLLINLVMVGVLLNIGAQAREPNEMRRLSLAR